MGTERRHHPRFTLDQMIELGYNKERYVGAEALNASEGGILCRTAVFFERYTQVFMMLSLPNGKKVDTIQCEGVVVRSEPVGNIWETAISLTIISDYERALFSEYLHRVKSLESV